MAFQTLDTYMGHLNWALNLWQSKKENMHFHGTLRHDLKHTFNMPSVYFQVPYGDAALSPLALYRTWMITLYVTCWRLISPLLSSCNRIKVIWVLLLFWVYFPGNSLIIWLLFLLSLQIICGRGLLVEASHGNGERFQAHFIIVIWGFWLAKSSWQQFYRILIISLA